MTLVTSICFMPVGGALVLANVAGAVAARGANRAPFAVFAIAGAIALLCVVLFGFPTSVTQEVTVVKQ